MKSKDLLAAFGAFLCIFFMAAVSELDANNIWIIPPFGASLVLVMAVHESPLASARNVFFGHILSAFSGVIVFYFIGESPVAIALGLALAIILMMISKTVHPPAGANPIIAILGAKTFDFVIMPVAIGASFIVIFAWIYNKIWKR